jgi:cytochrome c5
LAPLGLLTAAEDKAEKAPKAEKPAESRSAADSSNKRPIIAPRKLSGAELYSMHCNRCHPERYPTERTAAQWKTILLHMRVRANLPAEQSRTILKYLQDNSGR